MPICLNCDTPLHDAYCAHCGQRADTRRLDWRWLLVEVPQGLLNVNRGLLHTLRELFARPGTMLRGYLAGKRAEHYRPLTMIMVLGAAYSFGFFLLTREVMPAEVPDAARRAIEGAIRGIMSYYALLEVALVPLFTFWAWLLMRGYGHSFVEHLVANTYLSGQRIVVNIAGLPFSALGFAATAMYTNVAFVLYCVYFVLAYVQLYPERGATGTAVRSMAAFLLAWTVVLAVAVGWGVYMAVREAQAQAVPGG